MQDGTNQTAAALRNAGLTSVLSNRQIIAGTWGIVTAGTLTESANASSCRVFLQVPAPCRLLGVTVVGRQDSGATSQFTANLLEASSTATITPLGVTATSDGVTTGTDQTIYSEITDGYVTVVGRRYAILLGTTGGGATQRTFISATIHFDLLI